MKQFLVNLNVTVIAEDEQEALELLGDELDSLDGGDDYTWYGGYAGMKVIAETSPNNGEREVK